MPSWDRVEELHRGERSALTRVRHPQDGAAYVIKKSLLPSSADALEREQRVLAVLIGCEGLIRSFGVAGGALVLEYFEGESLAKRLLRGRILPANALTLGLSILTTLGRVHARGIVHGDLSTENVLLASDGGCRLIDFASAVPIGSELEAGHAAHDARALAYAAPEQVRSPRRAPGRLDRRTDYYRFGALLYELLTGRPPFDGVDPGELALTHGTRRPTPPRELVPDLSPALERVLLKLLAKDPDARFQSEARLRDALECCLGAARRGDRNFDGLSTAAEAPAFVPSARLFGRDAVLMRVEQTTDRALRGQRCLTVLEGPAGIGKSAVAEEIGRRIRARHGFFVRIAFEAENVADPGLPLQRALETLSEQLEQLAGAHLLAVGERLEQRVPGASGALVACCPALAAALPRGAPAELREGNLEPTPRAFGALLRVLSEQGPPVCLFVDDLQWIPASSWHAVREILRAAERAPIALVSATRTDDLGGAQRSRALLEELTTDGYTTSVEKLEPVGRADVRKLVVASITQKAADLGALDELLWTWSRGNPLYAHTLLEAMAQRCVAFDAQGRPFVELGLARSLLAEGDVDALLGQRFRALPADTRHALKLAACLGFSFDPAILAPVVHGDVSACLAPGVSAGLLAPFGTSPRAVRAQFSSELARAVVSDGLTDADRAGRHLELGRVLLQRLSTGHDKRTLFAVVEHLERARPLLTAAEVQELAALQLRATREATRSGHGDLALALAHRAIGALPDGAWDHGAARVRTLLLAQADAALSSGDTEIVSAVVEALHAHAIEPQHFADALTLEGRIHEAQHRESRAVEAYLQALSVLRAPVAEKPSEREVAVERARTAAQLAGVSDEAVLSLAECRDERVRRELSLLGKLMLSTSAQEAQRALVACRIIRHGLRHGHTPETACGFAHHARLLRDEDLPQAIRNGRMALALAERFGSGVVLAHVQLRLSTDLQVLTVPVKRLVPQLVKAHQAALDAGAHLLAGASASALDFARVWAGEPLNRVWDTLAEHRELLKHLKQKPALNANAAWRELVHQLREPSAEPGQLAGTYYNDGPGALQQHDTDDAVSSLHDTLTRLFLAILYGMPSFARPALAVCETLRALHEGSFWSAPLCALEALARLLDYGSVPEEQRAQESARIQAVIAELTRFAARNPEEGEPRLRLVTGLEAARVGDSERAAQLLREAVELAAREGPLWEAIAAEFTGRYWLTRGEREEARACLRRAHDGYLAWGAHEKGNVLAHQHAGLLDAALPEAGEQATSALAADDLRRVIAALRPVGGELRIEPLMARLSTTLTELVEADREPLARRTIALLALVAEQVSSALEQARKVETARE